MTDCHNRLHLYDELPSPAYRIFHKWWQGGVNPAWRGQSHFGQKVNAPILTNAQHRMGDDMAKKPTEEEMNRLIKEMEELAEAIEGETLKADAETFIKKFPDDAMGYFFLGSSKLDLGDFSEGLDNLDQAIRKNPKNANFYNNRGSIKDNLGRL